MIGKIRGQLVEIENNLGLIETASGIFYNVYLTNHQLGVINFPKPVEIYTYLQVREDALVLFGFETKQELQFFHLLLSVSGVGPKTAFTVISFSKPTDIFSAIKQNDVEYFTRVPGLGKKTAMKIILELSQKLKQEFKFENVQETEVDKTVVEALIALGFKAQEARSALAKIPADLPVEEKIKLALKRNTK